MHTGALVFVAYALACSATHGLLQLHYTGYCRGSWLALFALDPSPYCALVRRSLDALQWSPLLLAAPMALRGRGADAALR